ncbi:hypothetical protein IQ269_04350 [Tychonema sp. LEGE 07199]|uniref:hypothetical protein n=1 Tax=unclassified Tychonema TaxID=2642144 RepID=UPI001882EC4C|nr:MULTISPECIES: hypothetical protein [unclassified Tychonema]MBE9120053.1 hypothetical protein [Tychonema sp. LEGE 07199]MBE9132521.1 hypothetical protein [Tychonema sp. LEGE 07196]
MIYRHCDLPLNAVKKKEEGRRKKEEGRRKKEEGRRKKEEGRRKKSVGAVDGACPPSCRH